MDNQERWARLARHLGEIGKLEEKVRKILENPASYVSENGGLTNKEQVLLDNFYDSIDAVKEILKRYGI